MEIQSTFERAASGRVARWLAPLGLAVLTGCASVPDRMVDSCMKRGGGFNLLGLIAVQDKDDFNYDCDQGRDLALIARKPEGGVDPLGSLVAQATVLKKSPELAKNYYAALRAEGMTPEAAQAAANKVLREARQGVLVCKAGDNGKEKCRYERPQPPAAAASAPAASGAASAPAQALK